MIPEQQPLNKQAQAEFDRGNNILGRRAFRMQSKVGDLLRLLCFLLGSLTDKHHHSGLLRTIRGWLLVPFTLWPIDFNGLGRFVAGEIAAGREMAPKMEALLYFAKDLPSEHTQRVIAEYEHIVHQGAYDGLVRDTTKYTVELKRLLENSSFPSDWAKIKELFDVTQFQTKDSKEIIRRTLVCERNMRSGFEFRWDTEEDRFYRIFDCFCTKHNLYGMQGDTPLLMKVTANPTPHGLMLFIPAWMSLDIWRDLVHSKISELQRCRGIRRQGATFSERRLEREEFGKNIVAAEVVADEKKLTGTDRLEFILEQVGLPKKTNARHVRKLRELGRKALAAEQAERDRLTLATSGEEESSPRDQLARRVALAERECKVKKLTGARRVEHIIAKAELPPNTSKRTIGRLRDLGETLLAADDAAAAQLRDRAQNPLANNPRLAQAKAAVAGLSAEEKCELMKWMGAQG